MLQANITSRLSAIIPVGRRHADLGELHREYRRGVLQTGRDCQFIYVLDGHYPDALAALETLLRAGERLTVLQLSRGRLHSSTRSTGWLRARAWRTRCCVPQTPARAARRH